MNYFDEEDKSVNTEEVADPQLTNTDLEEEIGNDIESEENLEVADPDEVEFSDDDSHTETIKEEKKEKTEDDAKFAAARRESEKLAKEAKAEALALKQRQDEFAKQLGFNNFEAVEEYQRQRVYIEQGYDENVAKKLADVDKLQKDLQQKAQQARIVEQKSLLQDDPYFKEFEPEIDEILHANPHLELDVGLLFQTVKGKNIDKILAMNSKATKQQALNTLNSKNHIKPDGKGYESETIVADEKEWQFYKRLNPKATKEGWIKFLKTEKKGR